MFGVVIGIFTILPMGELRGNDQINESWSQREDSKYNSIYNTINENSYGAIINLSEDISGGIKNQNSTDRNLLDDITGYFTGGFMGTLKYFWDLPQRVVEIVSAIVSGTDTIHEVNGTPSMWVAVARAMMLIMISFMIINIFMRFR